MYSSTNPTTTFKVVAVANSWNVTTTYFKDIISVNKYIYDNKEKYDHYEISHPTKYKKPYTEIISTYDLR